MAITLSYLEDHDKIHPDDWMRPLNRMADVDAYSSEWCETSCYGGGPMDHLRWSPVWLHLGSVWWGKTIKEYRGFGRTEIVKYEFVSGGIPLDRTLLTNPKWLARHPLWWNQVYSSIYSQIMGESVKFGKYKSYTNNTVEDILFKYRDASYVNWMINNMSNDITIGLDFLKAFQQYSTYSDEAVYRKFSNDTIQLTYSTKEYERSLYPRSSFSDMTYLESFKKGK